MKTPKLTIPSSNEAMEELELNTKLAGISAGVNPYDDKYNSQENVGGKTTDTPCKKASSNANSLTPDALSYSSRAEQLKKGCKENSCGIYDNVWYELCPECKRAIEQYKEDCIQFLKDLDKLGHYNNESLSRTARFQAIKEHYEDELKILEEILEGK